MNVGVPGILFIRPLQVYQVPDSAVWGWGGVARQNLNYVSFGKLMYFPGGHCEKIRIAMHLIPIQLSVSC